MNCMCPSDWAPPTSHNLNSLEQLLIRHAQVNACLRQLNARIAALTHEERRLRRDIERSFEAEFAETAPEQYPVRQVGEFRLGYRRTRLAVHLAPTIREPHVIEQLRQLAPYYLRTRTELARARMLADRNLPHQVELLRRVGISLEQRREFAISQ
jgi:hypothetical protein